MTVRVGRLLLLFAWALLAAAESDLYKILGVKRSADDKEIKKAYRKLSLELHPDKNPSEDAADRFAEVSTAYAVLSDSEKRRVYDQQGEEGLKRHEQQGQGRGDPFSSIFEAFGFGGRGRGASQEEQRTANVEVPLRVPLKDLYLGDVIELKYVRHVVCLQSAECQKSCPDCQGAGVRLKQQQLAPGFVQQVQVRDDQCVAHGKCWRANCRACPDGKTSKEPLDLTVDVEAGMRDGDVIVFENAADEKIGTTAGDLVFKIQTIPNARFTRVGDHLYMGRTISLLDALVGFSFSVVHLDGREVKVTKDDITACGDVFKVAGEGMPIRGRGKGARGDLLITFDVDFPSALSDAQKASARAALG